MLNHSADDRLACFDLSRSGLDLVKICYDLVSSIFCDPDGGGNGTTNRMPNESIF